MATRNFWIDARIDGRETELCGGPRAKDGGMEITIMQREKGGKVKAFTISSCVDYETGNLTTWVKDSNDNVVSKFETER